VTRSAVEACSTGPAGTAAPTRRWAGVWSTVCAAHCTAGSSTSTAGALQADAASGLQAIECLVPACDWQRQCRQAVQARREQPAWLSA